MLDPLAILAPAPLLDALNTAATLVDTNGIVRYINDAFLEHARVRGRDIKREDRIGHHINNFIQRPSLQRQFDDFLGRVLQGDAIERMIWRDFALERPLARVEVEGWPLLSNGAVVGALILRRDAGHTTDYETYHKIYTDLENSFWQMKSSADIAHLIKDVYRALNRFGLSLSNCGVNWVEDIRAEPPLIYIFGFGTTDEPQSLSSPHTSKLIIDFWQGGKPVYRRDLASEDHYGEYDHINDRFSAPIRSVIDIPFAYGTLAANSTEPDAFSDEDITVLLAVANRLETGFRRREDLDKLEERERLQGALEMAGAVSHELSQPLQAIAGTLFELETGLPADHPLQKHLSHLADQVTRTCDVFTRLGQVTRYRTRDYTADHRIIDIERAVDG